VRSRCFKAGRNSVHSSMRWLALRGEGGGKRSDDAEFLNPSGDGAVRFLQDHEPYGKGEKGGGRGQFALDERIKTSTGTIAATAGAIGEKEGARVSPKKVLLLLTADA